MATYVLLNTTKATASCGYRNALPTVFNRNRLFFRMDLTGSGLVLANITSVTFRINVTAFNGSEHYKLRHDAGSDNWGLTLEANATEYYSTKTNLEETLLIASTGQKSFTVNKNHLDLNGINWFRLDPIDLDASLENITVNMQEATQPDNRPQLIVVSAVAGAPSQLATLGLGAPLSSSQTTYWYGHASDGQIREDATEEPIPDQE